MTEIRECDICGQMVERSTSSTGAHFESEHDCRPPIFDLHEAFVVQMKELAALNAAVARLLNEVAALRCESARIARVFRAEGVLLSVNAPPPGRLMFNPIGLGEPVFFTPGCPKEDLSTSLPRAESPPVEHPQRSVPRSAGPR